MKKKLIIFIAIIAIIAGMLSMYFVLKRMAEVASQQRKKNFTLRKEAAIAREKCFDSCDRYDVKSKDYSLCEEKCYNEYKKFIKDNNVSIFP